MFIIERALNIFTLINDMEAQINMKEPQLGKIKLGGSILNVNPTLDNVLNKPSSGNSSFVPNQLILNNALINAIKQNSESKDRLNILNEKEATNPQEETYSKKIPSFPVIDSKDISFSKSHEFVKDHSKTVVPIELSKIASPNQSNKTNNQYSFVSALSSPNGNYNTSQSSDSLLNERPREIPTSSPRFVRINSNLVDHKLNSQRVIVPNSGIKNGNIIFSSPSIQVYNTNIQGTDRRTVWPNNNLINNGGIRDVLASPISSRSKNSFSPNVIQRINSPKGNISINSNFRYTVTPNPSVARYIEKSTEGLSSPIGFSPLASPTYRKNIPQNKSGYFSNAATANSVPNNQVYSYKN